MLSGTDYYIQIDPTAFDDADGNSYAGKFYLHDKTTLNFTTGDFTNPSLISSNPTNNATAVAVGSHITKFF